MALEILDTIVGDGPVVELGDRLVVDYTGTYVDANGQEVTFDSSEGRPAPFMFEIGANRVIQGWEQGLLGMNVGGERTLVIPPELAYGDVGTATIPGGATLTFNVRLHAAESFPAEALFQIEFAAVPNNFQLEFGSRDPLAPDDTIIVDPAIAASYWIQSFGGVDTIEAGSFSDVVFAGEGDDTMDGRAGDDVFIAGGGNDRITGGLGFYDTAVYEGDFAEYNLTVVAPEVVDPAPVVDPVPGVDPAATTDPAAATDPAAVVDPAPAVSLISVEDTLAGRDGTDVIDGVEWLIFKDRYVQVSVVDGAVVVVDTILLTPPVVDPAPAADQVSVAASSVSAPSSSPAASAPAPAEEVLAPATSEPVDASAADALISPQLVKLSRGRSVQRCTDDLDRFVYTKQSLDRKVDRIIGFDTSRDKIIFEGHKWARKLGVSLVNVDSKQELKMAQYSTASFIYNEGNGNLYCNANGDKKSWGGKGGKFARLDSDLDVNPSNFAIF